MEIGVHMFSVSVELNVSTCVFFPAILFMSLAVLNCVIRKPS